MKRCNGNAFGVLRQRVYLVVRVKESRMQNAHNIYIDVMLQNYMKHVGRNKFNDVHTDSKWIYVDYPIYIVTMSYNAANKLYTLDRIDAGEP